jgi:hypothetical protein
MSTLVTNSAIIALTTPRMHRAEHTFSGEVGKQNSMCFRESEQSDVDEEGKENRGSVSRNIWRTVK